jgi:hypothetical protein
VVAPGAARLTLPRRSQQTAEVKAIIDEVNRLGFTADLETFARMQAEADLDGWGDAFPYSRGAMHVTLEELVAFFEEYVELVKRYQRPAEEAPEDSRLMLTRFFAFPAPESS